MRGDKFWECSPYHIAQCKIPERDALEAHPEKLRTFGRRAVGDAQDALRYLLGNSQLKPNELVRRLYTLIESDKGKEGFALVFFIIVFGRLNDRAFDAVEELRQKYNNRPIRIVVQQLDDIVDDFILGAARAKDRIEMDIRIDSSGILKAHDYCYLLGNAADIFTAFKDYGWRLFDLNLRYEIRNSSVNGDIVNSLRHHKTRRYFHHYNNGLIIVCQSYRFRDNDEVARITNAQIVNGLQTVKSIYNAVSNKDVSYADLESECKVQIKVIRNDNPDFVSAIVQATNNQNPMTARNLRANSREQKSLRVQFAYYTPRWFLQVKQGELDSLLQEDGRFFKSVVGYPPSEFRPDPSKKKTRSVDNQDLAKAWLAFIGYSDFAGDRTAHYFSNEEVYRLAFCTTPQSDHWVDFASLADFRPSRRKALSEVQATAAEYLLAYFLWQFVRHFVPAPRHYRAEALDEGVREGKLQKASGTITSSLNAQEDYLADNHTYQTWRLMANMKEVLLESAAYVLSKRYRALDAAMCAKLLRKFEASDFLQTGDARDAAAFAAKETDLGKDQVFSRIMNLLKHTAGQFWEDKQNQIQSTSRIRTLLLRQDMVADFKRHIDEIDERKGLDRGWKPSGMKFIESLPDL